MSDNVLEIIDGAMAVRCRSQACDVPGGRVIYSTPSDGLIGVRRRGSGIVAIGIPVLLVCKCGWSWRNPSMSSLFDQIKRLEDG